MESPAINPPACQWCGKLGAHPGARCPEVRAIEFHQDGTLSRVEFMTPADSFVPLSSHALPANWPSVSWA